MSKDEIKSRMSEAERAKRRASVGKLASEKIRKSEQLNFRIEEKSIQDLQKIALKKGMPVGTMIRDWVMERLAREKLGSPQTADQALLVLDEMYAKLKSLFETSTTSAIATYQDSQGRPHIKRAVRETNK